MPYDYVIQDTGIITKIFKGEKDLLELGLIPEIYLDDSGDVNWDDLKEDADAVRLAKKVARGERVITLRGLDYPPTTQIVDSPRKAADEMKSGPITPDMLIPHVDSD